MPNTFTLIQAITVGSGGQANIEFTSIPATYTDLKLVFSLRDTRSNNANNFFISYNGSTSSLTYKYIFGNGSSVGMSSGTDGNIGVEPAATATSNTFGNGEIYIPNYTGSNNKSASADTVMENNATASEQWLLASLWSNSSAITSIRLTPGSGASYVQHSTAYLYGIVKS
jgi:hypothetical protein